MAGPESPCHIKPQKCRYFMSYFIYYNLFQDSPENIADGIVEIAQTFQSILPLVVYSLVMPAGLLIGC